MVIIIVVRTEIGLVSKLDWAQTLMAQTINLQSVDRRTRSIPEEKRLNLAVKDGLTQVRFVNLSSEQITQFVSYGFVQKIKLYKSSNPYPLFFPPPFLSTSFHVIYYNFGIILTTHVQVRFRGFLPVPSSTSQNHQPVAVRLLDHCSGITSTLMRPKSWLRGI